MSSVQDVLEVLEVDIATNGIVKKDRKENFYPPLQERFKNYNNTPRKAAFGWVGGKSRLANTIIAEFPQHMTYCEVFAGGLNVLFRKKRSKLEIINDINSELINLYKTIQNLPQTLSLYLNEMLLSRQIFDDIKHKRLLPHNNIQAAAYYFYRLSQSFSSTGDSYAMCKKDRAPKNIYRSFKVWSDRLRGVIIEKMDFSALIRNYDWENILFYIDPPYIGTENYYDMPSGFGIAQHELLAYLLENIKGKFVLSYNDCEVVRELYKNFVIKEVDVRYTMNAIVSTRKSKELIIKNF